MALEPPTGAPFYDGFYDGQPTGPSLAQPAHDIGVLSASLGANRGFRDHHPIHVRAMMNVRPVDPRDESWQDCTPSYRVCFWRRSPTSIERPNAEAGYESEEFEVTDADVQEVLAWASTTASAGRTYALYVLRRDRDGLGLIRLVGEDPTRSPRRH